MVNTRLIRLKLAACLTGVIKMATGKDVPPSDFGLSGSVCRFIIRKIEKKIITACLHWSKSCSGVEKVTFIILFIFCFTFLHEAISTRVLKLLRSLDERSHYSWWVFPQGALLQWTPHSCHHNTMPCMTDSEGSASCHFNMQLWQVPVLRALSCSAW